MTKKIRYSILLIGFMAFSALAPVIVLYVRGIKYDFQTKKFVSTGLLSTRVEPKNAGIYINGELLRKNSGDVNFLLPQDYEISIQKTGYNTWKKRLTINNGQVTWANPSGSSIYLLIDTPTPQNLAEGVLDFYQNKNFILYLTASSVNTTLLNNNLSARTYPLPKSAGKILANDGNKKFIIGNDGNAISPPTLMLFNATLGEFTDLSKLFTKLPKIQFDKNGDLLALTEGTLYKIDPQSRTKIALFTPVQTFYTQGSDVYFVMQKQGTASLQMSSAPFDQSQILITPLPTFSQGELFVTFEKQIYLLADRELYRASDTMEKIASDVEKVNYGPANSTLSVIHAGQVDYLNRFDSALNLLTRSSAIRNNADVQINIGWAFYINNNRLSAIELDTRDNQNNYVLYSGQNLQKFSLDNDAKNAVILDNGELKSLIIR